MFRNLFIVAAAAMTLAACASAPPNPINLQTRDTFFVKDASVDWKFDDSKKADDVKYNEGKADLQARLKTAVETEFKASPSGSEAVSFKIEVKGYFRVGGAQQILVGGGNSVAADVHVIRVSDGKELAVYTDVAGVHVPPAGLLGAAISAASKTEVEGVMANDFAKNLRKRFDAKK